MQQFKPLKKKAKKYSDIEEDFDPEETHSDEPTEIEINRIEHHSEILPLTHALKITQPLTKDENISK